MSKAKSKVKEANISSITISEKKLGREKALGECYFGTGQINIDPRQDSKEYLNTLIHEMAHLRMPEWDEQSIIDLATGFTEAIWAMGFRRIKD